MLRFLPSSISGLIAAGFFAAALPLAVALVLALNTLNSLSEHADRLLQDGILVSRLGEQLRERIDDLDTLAREYIRSGDEADLQRFYGRADAAIAAMESMQAMDLSSAYQAEIKSVRQALVGARGSWEDLLKEGYALSEPLTLIAGAQNKAEVMIEAGTQALLAEEKDLFAAVRRARWVIVFAVGGLIPLTVALGYGLAGVIARPVREARRQILELGRNRYDQPIRIGYPEELSTLGQQLEWLRRRLVNLEADKERFMRHVTHELKTPLASLKEGTELLADSSLGELNAQQAEVVGILQESTRDQEQMIMRLLSYAEWRLERRQDQPEWHNLQPLIEEAIAPSAMLRQAKQVELRLELEAQRIYGRRVALLEVLDNLLSNALKYAPMQSQVELRISSVGRATGSVCGIGVRDHGPGVPADQQERIFLPFEQGEQPAESTLRGSGLGLAIVAEICNELGGSVHVEDAHPGARFVCCWPAPDEPSVNADEQAQEGA